MPEIVLASLVVMKPMSILWFGHILISLNPRRWLKLVYLVRRTIAFACCYDGPNWEHHENRRKWRKGSLLRVRTQQWLLCFLVEQNGLWKTMKKGQSIIAYIELAEEDARGKNKFNIKLKWTWNSDIVSMI